MTTWRKDPPPHIGWWPASRTRDPAVFRYWNGTAWSRGYVRPLADPILPFEPSQHDIEWIEGAPVQDLEVQRAFKLLRSRGFRV